MKKYSILALALVLTAALFTGCGCTNRNGNYNTIPTTLPATHATTEPTHATTEMTTVPTNGAEHTVEPTVDHGNGPLEDTTATNATTATEGTVEGRARQHVPAAK